MYGVGVGHSSVRVMRLRGEPDKQLVRERAFDVIVPGFPNFYCMYGPGTNAVNGASIIYNSECQMRYIMGCIDMVMAGCLGSAMPRDLVCDDYTRRNQQRLSEMVYSPPAVTSSYYKNASGELPTLYGFRIFDLWRWTNRVNPDDYEMRA